MEPDADPSRDLILLEKIEQNPDATQASLAAQLGVAVGTVNWHLKRLIAKGYVKVRRAERRKLRYIITPEGISLRAYLTLDYIQNQFRLYRATRERVQGLLDEVRLAGFDQVNLLGDGDVADICRLTCLEQGIAIIADEQIPALEVQGLKVQVNWKDTNGRGPHEE
ncbi:MAG TPA: winged helix-turn-helix transcriptional regulator [Anaerolineaceae bacterium]|nr:winged helix-turn-helix transcriptional regulator [Anaerolineaceae bacterium]